MAGWISDQWEKTKAETQGLGSSVEKSLKGTRDTLANPADWQKGSLKKGRDELVGAMRKATTSGNSSNMDTGRGIFEPSVPTTGPGTTDYKTGERTPTLEEMRYTFEEGIAKTREQQSSQIEMLQKMAAGEGPSAAQDQLKLATDQNMRQALSMAASGRGNPALAMQAAGRDRAIMGQQAGAQSAALRAQEMQSGQQQLAGALEAQRQQDLGDQQRVLQYQQLEAQIEIEQDRLMQAKASADRDRQQQSEDRIWTMMSDMMQMFVSA